MKKTREASPARRAVFALLAVGLSSVLGLAACEIVLRLRQGTGLPAQLALFEENPSGAGSFRLRPNLHVTTRVGGRPVTIVTNSQGMPQETEVTRENPQGRTRIAFLGDSFAFGLWASDAAHGFVGVVAERLGTEGYEVMNFGVTGYGLDDMALLLREEAAAFAPSYVVVASYNGNDFADTLLGTSKMKVLGGALDFDEENVERKVPAEYRRHRGGTASSWRTFIRRHFATYQALGGVKRAIFFDVEDLFQDSLEVSPELLSYTFWSQVPYPPVAEEARDASLRCLDEIRVLTEKLGARLLVVTVPYLEQVYVREPRGPGYDISYPQRFVEEWAAERGVGYLDLLPALRRHVAEKRDELFVRAEIHFNDAGHALVGQLVYEWLAGILEKEEDP